MPPAAAACLCSCVGPCTDAAAAGASRVSTRLSRRLLNGRTRHLPLPAGASAHVQRCHCSPPLSGFTSRFASIGAVLSHRRRRCRHCSSRVRWLLPSAAGLLLVLIMCSCLADCCWERLFAKNQRRGRAHARASAAAFTTATRGRTLSWAPCAHPHIYFADCAAFAFAVTFCDNVTVPPPAAVALTPPPPSPATIIRYRILAAPTGGSIAGLMPLPLASIDVQLVCIGNEEQQAAAGEPAPSTGGGAA